MNRKLLYVVGIGPGKPEGMTKEAKAALDDSELLVGYPLYLSLLGTEYDKKEKKSTGMTAEMERCRMALSEADSGRTVALICSGDPGIYGMAGPVLSLSGAYPEVKIRIIPGVTAATGGAALLGEKCENVFSFGDHGSTFGGNPVACAGAVSIIKRIDRKLLDGVKRRSEYIFSSLSGAPGVEGVSGMGLMIGIKTSRPAAEVVKECISRGVLCLTAKDRVRLLPALNINEKTLKKAVGIIKKVCAGE